jgi:hypothetical protein
MMLEVLNSALVVLSLLARRERPQIPALAGLGVDFSRIEPIAACFEFSNHDFLQSAMTVLALPFPRRAGSSRFAGARTALFRRLMLQSRLRGPFGGL